MTTHPLRCPDCAGKLKRWGRMQLDCATCRQSYTRPYLRGYWRGVKEGMAHALAHIPATLKRVP